MLGGPCAGSPDRSSDQEKVVGSSAIHASSAQALVGIKISRWGRGLSMHGDAKGKRHAHAHFKQHQALIESAHNRFSTERGIGNTCIFVNVAQAFWTLHNDYACSISMTVKNCKTLGLQNKVKTHLGS